MRSSHSLDRVETAFDDARLYEPSSGSGSRPADDGRTRRCRARGRVRYHAERRSGYRPQTITRLESTANSGSVVGSASVVVKAERQSEALIEHETVGL
jgi:hypothetical protein